LAVVYHPPAYTDLPPSRLASSDGEVAGVAGTKVRLEVTATKELRSAELVTRADAKRPSEVLPLEKAGEGEARSATFVLWAPGAKATPAQAGKRLLLAPTAYQVKMEDSEGYANADPLWRSVALKADQPPEVVLRVADDRPVRGPGAVLPLAVECR